MQSWKEVKAQYGDSVNACHEAWHEAAKTNDPIEYRVAELRTAMLEAYRENGDGFRHSLFRTLAKADEENRENLRLGFPLFVAIYEDYAYGKIIQEALGL